MSAKRIIYTRPDGGVSVVTPAPEFVAHFPTEAEALAVILSTDIPGGAEFNRQRKADLLQAGLASEVADAVIAGEAATNVMVCDATDSKSRTRRER